MIECLHSVHPSDGATVHPGFMTDYIILSASDDERVPLRASTSEDETEGDDRPDETPEPHGTPDEGEEDFDGEDLELYEEEEESEE